ncbi:MAG: bifunctional DNA primase/polymerase [Streptosporangiaceae bacterium]
MSTDPTVGRALAYAACGWPVFPCQPGSKQPATRHGFLDATTDPERIAWWWRREPGANLAIATGTPGPDVLDVDQHGEAGSGYGALNRLARAGLTRDAGAVVATPHGGLHLYYAGSGQGCGKLPAQHLDFRSRGGYVLAPPSRVDGRAYRVIRHQRVAGEFRWDAAVRLLDPGRQPGPRSGIRDAGGNADLSHLAAWVARLTEGNRNDGLFWAACRAAEAGDDAVLDGLADAARQAGLGGREITATIASARRTTTRQPQQREPGRQVGLTAIEHGPAGGQAGWECAS